MWSVVWLIYANILETTYVGNYLQRTFKTFHADYNIAADQLEEK